MKMQFKLTAVLVLVGLCSCLTVGAAAYWMVLRDFRQAVADHAFLMFKHDIVGYVAEYGSLDAAEQAEPFNSFVTRQHRLHPPVMPEEIDESPLIDRLEHPPFRFLLMTPDGVVRQPVQGLSIGDKAPVDVLDKSEPIEFQGTIIALAAPIGDMALTPEDQHYLAAVERALMTGLFIAVSLSIVLGVFFGRGMSRTVRQLTKAVKSLHADKEGVHHVEVTSGDELGELAVAFNDMNDELAVAHRELRQLSTRDSLTGLYNRRYFDEQARLAFEQARRTSMPLSMMIADLDHFKQINDVFSHEVGDEVLTRVGAILKGITRKTDIVARYGGEEFVMVFANTSKEQAGAICEKIRHAVESHQWEEVHPGLHVTMSIGVCGSGSSGSMEEMLARADTLLYSAKAGGRNRVVDRKAN